VYALLYGTGRSISAVTTADNFDHSVTNDAFVVLDNVDTYERWLPDRLALSASTSDVTKRKLWTDADIVTLKRQALVGLTAHAPKFGREDVADRLLTVTLERLTNFSAEGDIIKSVLTNRNRIWGAILQDIQTILKTPVPTEDIPQFRVEDFARIGYWIATALGIQDAFRDMIVTARTAQRSFVLDEDSLLVGSILVFTSKSNKANEWVAPGELWSQLELFSGDPPTFKKVYKNAQELGRKLWTMQDSLKDIVTINWKVDSSKGTRLWSLGAKDATS
jgi:hypothetical protein